MTLKFLVILSLTISVVANANTLKIATYNVRNLYDKYDDPYIQDMSREMGTTPKPTAELKALAATIIELNADVIALQEVENRATLESFNQKYLAKMGYRETILIEANNSHIGDYSRGIDVAVLSRVPVSKVTTYQNRIYKIQGSSKKYSRDFLRVTLEAPSFPKIELFVLHAPSKRGEGKAYYQRLAEAKQSVGILEEEFDSNAFIIVTGDFNDEPDSDSLKIFTGSSKVKLERLIIKDNKNRPFSWYGFGKSKYPPTTFDHILVSLPLKKMLVKSQILNTKIAAQASDHRPVSITIKSIKK